MLDNLFTSKARVEILKLFLFNPEESFYQRQISTLTKQPIRGVQREVEKLQKLNLIEKSIKGNRIYYKTNKNCPIFVDLKKILFKTEGIAKALREDVTQSPSIKIAFIYGSYAKGKETISSDIDLFVIGTISNKELSRLIAKPKNELKREINYTVFSENEFKRRLQKNDHFLKTILDEPKIFIKGTFNDLKAIA